MKIIDDPDLVSQYIERFGWSGMCSAPAAGEFRLCRYDAGEIILRAGDELPGLLLFVEGRAKVFRSLENGQTMLVRFYYPLQIMGDVELFTRKNAAASVDAVGKALCLLLPMEAARREIESNIPLLKILAQGLAEKLVSFNATSAVNQNYPLRTRLADYLIMTFLENDQYREELKTVNLGEMAAFLGCSYRHLTRTLEEFKRQGILEKKGRAFRILDPDALKAIAREAFRSELAPF